MKKPYTRQEVADFAGKIRRRRAAVKDSKQKRAANAETADKAAEIYCQVLADRDYVVVGNDQIAGRRVAKKLRDAPVGRRRIVGRAILRKYRVDTGVVGAINWQAFRDWLAEHHAEITALGVVLKVLTLLLML